MTTSTSAACDRMQCMEVWGGNSRVDRKIGVPGLNVWVHSRPYNRAEAGNGPLEDLHAGAYSPLLEDDSLSRITDAEMKTLMLHACRQLAELLTLKRNNPEEYDRQIKSYAFRYCRSWER